MQTDFFFKNLSSQEKEISREYFLSKIERIGKFIKNVPEDAVKLRVQIEKFATKEAYKAVLTLKVLNDRLYVWEDDHTLHEAIDLAVDKLIRQLKHHRAKRADKRRK